MSALDQNALPSWDTLDRLVDTDPIELRNQAWRMRSEVECLTSTAHTQARMISELTSACMAAERERDRLALAARDSDAYALDVELTKVNAERADLANQVDVLKDHVAALESDARAALAIDWDALKGAVASLEDVEESAVSAVLAAFRKAVQP